MIWHSLILHDRLDVWPSMTTSLDDIPVLILSQHIFPFVGSGSDAFVSSVSKKFQQSYRSSFPKPRTALSEAVSAVSTTEIFLRHCLYRHKYKACDAAAKTGNIDVLKQARSMGCAWSENTCRLAAQEGNFETLKWLHENKCPWNHTTCTEAARQGHLETVLWAHEQGCPWNSSTCAAAAEGGHFELLQRLRDL